MKVIKLLFCMIIMVVFSLGQIPQLINYQGNLADSEGNPLSGSYSMEFRIYGQSEGGEPEWSETQTVAVSDGKFNVLLGSVNTLSTDLFDGNAIYLSMEVGEDGEMTPRKIITSVGYAYKALDADKLGGKSAGEYVEEDEANAVTEEMIAPDIVSTINGVSNDGGHINLVAGSNVTITPDDENNQITISSTGGGGEGDNLGNHSATRNLIMNNNWISNDGQSKGIYVSSDGNVGINTTEFGDNAWNAQFQSTTPMYGAAIAGFSTNTATASVGGYFKAESPSGYGVFARSSGLDGVGVYGSAPGENGRAIYGFCTGLNGKAFYGVATRENGIGVHGRATNSVNTDENSYGGYFESSGYRGRGVLGQATGYYGYGVQAEATGDYGRAVSATATGAGGYAVYALATEDYGLGVYGHSTAEKGKAVYGWASYSSSSSSNNYGGYFTSSGERGRGVYGKATGTYGYGVCGEATGNNGPGVFGIASGDYGRAIYGYSPNYLAGYFYGDVDIDGTLSKSAGSFKIDHPLDPENKYLQHSFVESPDMMNVYNGNVILDGNGEATVELPDYFEALNIDFRYQLTCIGGFAPVYIADKINNNQFRIAGGEAGMEISWQVTGVRNDAYARSHRIDVEVPKERRDQGKYLFPKAHNQPESMGIHYEEQQIFLKNDDIEK